MEWYLSRIRLSRCPVVRVLEDTLKQPDAGHRRSAQHNMLWSAFATDPDQKRDFLWRAESDGSFITLSPRPPRDDNELFEKPVVKPFAPQLQAGDRLRFQLQVNATRMKRDTGKYSTIKRMKRDSIYYQPRVVTMWLLLGKISLYG